MSGFLIDFTTSGGGVLRLTGNANAVSGQPGLFQITSEAGGSTIDNPTFDSPVGPDSGSDNYIYYTHDFDGYDNPSGTPVIDTSGLSFHIGGTANDPTIVNYHIFADPTSSTGYTLTGSDGYTTPVSVKVLQVACLVTGTLIRTASGEVPVEALTVGDRVVTASGKARPVRWIGHRTLRCAGPAAREAWPVRVLKDAFAPGAPARDLWLSPGHAVCVDVVGEVFIPVGKLVNGATIVPVEVDEVTYWHVELDRHDVLLADGLPAESYLDQGNRGWFAGRGGVPDAGADAGHCRPFHDTGPLVEAVRARLRDRAEALGWRTTRIPAMHLVADGVQIEGEVAGGAARFVLPADARKVRLVSPGFVPALWGARGDERTLGLLLGALWVSDGPGTDRAIDIADPRLGQGFHAPETHDGQAWRWTDGDARLPSELWTGFRGELVLRIDFHPEASRCWLPPATAIPHGGNVVRLRAA